MARALAIARRIADDVVRRHTAATVLVTGSVARGRAMAGADLDMVAIVDAPVAGDRVESRIVDGVQVDLEWLTRGEALAMTEGRGWTWEMRRAARLGHAIAVHDTRGLAPMLAARAAAMQPDPARFEADLGRVYAALGLIGQGAGTPSERGDMARAGIDTLVHLVLLISPGRYQKPKWVMDDLAALGETGLIEALGAAYGTRDDPGFDAVGALVDAVLDSRGAPPREQLLGYAPDHPGEGLLARTHADAIDLARGGRSAAAVFVARFAARMAMTLAPDTPQFRAMHDAIFADVPPPARDDLLAMLDAADRCAAWLARDGEAAAA